MGLFATATDLSRDADLLRSRRYGVIEVAAGRLAAVHLRPWPKLVSLPEVLLDHYWFHERRRADRLWLYYNQPRSCSNYLALVYAVSGKSTRLNTMFAALRTLDEIARIKQTDAMVCDVANYRISPRLLAREGWQPHKPSRWHRHYIKRFYGQYPSVATSCQLVASAC
jgi:hypothetical protein